MLKFRPKLRFDGLYICKFHYVRYGLSYGLDIGSRPSFDVFYYKYLKFYDDGSMVFVYTSMPPAKFVPKFLAHQDNLFALMEAMPEKTKFVKGKKKDKSKGAMLQTKKTDISIQTGYWKIFDDRVCMVSSSGSQSTDLDEHHRYDAKLIRNTKYMRVSYDAEEEMIIKTKPEDENQRVIGDPLQYDDVVNKLDLDEYSVPDADYLEIEFFGMKMTEEAFRAVHRLAYN